jgi:ribosomal protein S12 methylthiotransferase
MNRYDCIIPYLDMPVQHASDQVLGLMRRAETNASLRKLYRRIRDLRPDITLRSTVIVGHPGEHDADFDRLMDFAEEIRFDRLGSFVYSDEEGTHAYALENKVPKKKALQRQRRLMELQKKISLQKNQDLIGTRQLVLIDEYHADLNTFSGRRMQDAPEIDNEVIIKAGPEKGDLTGTFQPVEITDASEYELYASFVLSKEKERAS